jgi:DNA-binding LacI/PurR family transcriptional regulator/DNA-binding transcriptional regulator YhcF (GntR family)
MASSTSKGPRILELADRIASDIRRRKLKPGDAYLGTADIARMLRVSSTTANRALQLLARRQVLVRKQRRGTLIARPPSPEAASSLRRLHLLVHNDYLRSEGLLADGLVLGIQGQLPAAEIQFNFFPETNEAAYVEQLVAEALRASGTEGFALVRSSVQAQRLLLASGLPTVITGTLMPSIVGLSFVDRDHAQIGRLMAEHMRQVRCRRVAVLLRDRPGEGDHLLLDSVGKELGAAGFRVDCLQVRCLPADEPAVRSAVQTLIDDGPKPLGLICRSRPIAEAAAAACARAPRQAHVALCDIYRKDQAEPTYPYIEPLLSAEETGAQIAQMLERQARGATAPEHLIIPVRLRVPE